MALTRQTPRFAELATHIEAEIAGSGIPHPPASLVDAALNAQIEHVAQTLGVEAPRALKFASDEAASVIATVLVEVAADELGDHPVTERDRTRWS